MFVAGLVIVITSTISLFMFGSWANGMLIGVGLLLMLPAAVRLKKARSLEETAALQERKFEGFRLRTDRDSLRRAMRTGTILSVVIGGGSIAAGVLTVGLLTAGLWPVTVASVLLGLVPICAGTFLTILMTRKGPTDETENLAAIMQDGQTERDAHDAAGGDPEAWVK